MEQARTHYGSRPTKLRTSAVCDDRLGKRSHAILKSVCVYCGASPGNRLEYVAAARELGVLLAKRGTTLVYGGGGVGVMGEIARAVVESGGDAIGVIPEHLNGPERAFHHPRVELRVTRTMHERKALMADLADGFIALPGGIGTFDELFEILTWRHLGLHGKPIGVLNVAGYFDPLIEMMMRGKREGLVRDGAFEALIIGDETGELLNRMERAGI